MVISEKLRNMPDYKSKDDMPSFDGIFYSSWIVKSGSEDGKFYLQESIQKLIDFQWEESKLILKPLFTMYIFMFCIPVVVTFFANDKDSKTLQFWMNMTAMVPASLLFCIELTQLKE